MDSLPLLVVNEASKKIFVEGVLGGFEKRIIRSTAALSLAEHDKATIRVRSTADVPGKQIPGLFSAMESVK